MKLCVKWSHEMIRAPHSSQLLRGSAVTRHLGPGTGRMQNCGWKSECFLFSLLIVFTGTPSYDTTLYFGMIL